MAIEINGWASGHSFKGSIFLISGNQHLPVSHMQTKSVRWPADVTRINPNAANEISTDSGWLTVGQNQTAASHFHFKYHSKTEDRLHFMLMLADEPDRKLGKSRNGYLGLYEHATVTDYWKLEPLAWTDTTLRCRIRDHQGHVIGLETGSPRYLKAGDGSPHEFVIARLE